MCARLIKSVNTVKFYPLSYILIVKDPRTTSNVPSTTPYVSTEFSTTELPKYKSALIGPWEAWARGYGDSCIHHYLYQCLHYSQARMQSRCVGCDEGWVTYFNGNVIVYSKYFARQFF